MKRHLVMIGDLDVPMQQRLCTQIWNLNTLGSERITLVVDSAGGDVEAAMYVCDTIKHSNAEVHGIVVGGAVSAAFRVLQACHWRTAYPHAQLLFHPTRLSSAFHVEQKDLYEKIAECRRQYRQFLNELSKRSGQSFKSLLALSASEKFFSARDAKRYGFLDKIVYPHMCR